MITQDEYKRIINNLAFEIHEAGKLNKVTASLEFKWSMELKPFATMLTRTKISQMGPVITSLGDTFEYTIDPEYNVWIYINGEKLIYRDIDGKP